MEPRRKLTQIVAAHRPFLSFELKEKALHLDGDRHEARTTGVPTG
jgi:hypothetical protein